MEPDNADALHFLGLIAHQAGQSDAGEELIRRSMALQPDNAQFHFNLGGLLFERRRYAAAFEAYRRATELKPDYLDAQLRFAETAAELGEADAAVECYRDILAAHPDDADLRHRAALACMNLGRARRAQRHATQAIELDPHFADAYNTLGILCGNLGEFDKATGHYRQAIDIDPVHCSAWFNLAHSTRMQPASSDLEALEKLYREQQNAADEERILLEFALGKVRDDIGDYDSAFEHFAVGNRLKRSHIAYSEEDQQAFFDAMCRTFDADDLQSMSTGVSDSRLPIFILGVSRSGTTLVEQIVASHRDVHGAGEIKLLRQAIKRCIGPDRDDREIPQALAALGGKQLDDLGHDYLTRLQALEPNNARITDKLPGNVALIGLIHRLFPRAPMILCRRDPLDVCVSCYTRLFADGHGFAYDLQELARFYRMYERLLDHWRAVLPEGRMLEVRYEDVVGDLEGQARRIIDYCSLDWDENCLKFHETHRAIRTASLHQVRQPIYSSSIGRWRHYEKQLGPLLAALPARP